MIELISTAMVILASILGFFIKRLYNKVDEIMKSLQEHKVDDVRSYVTRKEHDEDIYYLKRDLSEMIVPIRQSVENIENFLRDKNR